MTRLSQIFVIFSFHDHFDHLTFRMILRAQFMSIRNHSINTVVKMQFKALSVAPVASFVNVIEHFWENFDTRKSPEASETSQCVTNDSNWDMKRLHGSYQRPCGYIRGSIDPPWPSSFPSKGHQRPSHVKNLTKPKNFSLRSLRPQQKLEAVTESSIQATSGHLSH